MLRHLTLFDRTKFLYYVDSTCVDFIEYDSIFVMLKKHLTSLIKVCYSLIGKAQLLLFYTI